MFVYLGVYETLLQFWKSAQYKWCTQRSDALYHCYLDTISPFPPPSPHLLLIGNQFLQFLINFSFNSNVLMSRNVWFFTSHFSKMEGSIYYRYCFILCSFHWTGWPRNHSISICSNILLGFYSCIVLCCIDPQPVFNHPPVYGHLKCFQRSPMANSTAMK